MADLFGRFPKDSATFFIMQRLNMKGLKVEVPIPAICSPMYSFLYITEGRVLVDIGDKSYFFQIGECVIIPNGQIFTIRYFDNCMGYMGVFGSDFINKSEEHTKHIQHRKIHKVSFDKELLGYITGIFERLYLEDTTNKNSNIIRAYMVTLLAEIENMQSRTEQGVEILATDSGICNRFMELVFEKPYMKITIADYANQLSVSKEYLQKLVKRVTGKSPLTWMHEAIILEAKSLLFNTDLMVNEVAEKVGMEDAAYFSRMFNKYTGKSPLLFRKERKNPNIGPK